MKHTLAIALAANVALECASRPFEVKPHVEQNVSNDGTALPDRQGILYASGGNSGSDEPLAHLRWRVLYGLRAAARGKKLATLDAFVATARALLRDRPMKPWERRMQYQMLSSEIGLIRLRSRGCKDYSAALPAIACALGIEPIVKCH